MDANNRVYWWKTGVSDATAGRLPRIQKREGQFWVAGGGPWPTEWTPDFMAEAHLHYMRGYSSVFQDDVVAVLPGTPATFAASPQEIAALEDAIINCRGSNEQQACLINLLRTIAPWSEKLASWDEIAHRDGYEKAGSTANNARELLTRIKEKLTAATARGDLAFHTRINEEELADAAVCGDLKVLTRIYEELTELN